MTQRVIRGEVHRQVVDALGCRFLPPPQKKKNSAHCETEYKQAFVQQWLSFAFVPLECKACVQCVWAPTKVEITNPVPGQCVVLYQLPQQSRPSVLQQQYLQYLAELNPPQSACGFCAVHQIGSYKGPLQGSLRMAACCLNAVGCLFSPSHLSLCGGEAILHSGKFLLVNRSADLLCVFCSRGMNFISVLLSSLQPPHEYGFLWYSVKNTNSNFTSDFAILLRSSKISQKKKKKENVKTLASCSLWAAHSLVAELKWTEVKVRGYSVFFFPSLLEKKLMMNWSCRIYFHCAITLKYRTGQLGVILILPLGCVLIFSWEIPQQNAALTPELFSVGPLS